MSYNIYNILSIGLLTFAWISHFILYRKYFIEIFRILAPIAIILGLVLQFVYYFQFGELYFAGQSYMGEDAKPIIYILIILLFVAFVLLYISIFK